LFSRIYRYEIASGAPDWEDAERQVRIAAGKNGDMPTVSVKTAKASSKRKVGETAAEIYEREIGSRELKSKKSKAGGKRSRHD
jgi:N-acetyltransferase 10